jgi:hypothetical protein
MPHRTPTAAKSASPPPRGGRGTATTMGVGGCPTKTHPRRVRIHGAPLLATLLLATPTSAQVIPTGSPAADILLSQAIAEHRVFLTCSALDPATHQQILANWQRDTAAAVTVLTTRKVPPEAIAAFTTAARPENLMPAPDTPWADITALCATRPDWLTAYFQLNLTILELKLPGAFP